MRKFIFLASALFTGSCTFFAQDTCLDTGHVWDSTNKICTYDCVKQGGIFDLSENLCEIPPSYANKISEKEMFDSVAMACSDFREILKGEFDLELVSELGHYNSCLLYTSPSPRDKRQSRMPSSA